MVQVKRREQFITRQHWDSCVKMIILSKEIYRVSIIPIKLPMTFFTELEQTVFFQFVWKKKTLNSHSNLKKEKWSWKINLPWLQTHSGFSNQGSMVMAEKQKIQTSGTRQKARDKPMHLCHLNFDDKQGKIYSWRQRLSL